ncbi:MAG: hypothetical protein GWN99_06740 [Gemmatimonadetes bacterium]|uniref:Uncharacterized protein n=1 Tax=Candidatus Kutchimonas denitrificans TaxID=3056748 RepID=A0AAE5CAV0_9BACT|nr:hypothetical protein [Gemmatimonadota bacterium]NIR73710.1 hypothetical protein [Candidatus Kutchimonas denitrificans]NIS00760.1 hypothetical protein [Gemmatimonadota bacterium]NIT66347.1 hypothetical protein [Gemmatimonadota bacterium]NIU51565.1 hypothetical protein [Gemmatimonadota bacterium]
MHEPNDRINNVEYSLTRVAWEGAIGGVIGAAAVAIWFLAVDSLAGRPFYTPAVLGAQFFEAGAVADSSGMPQPTVVLVLGYTVVHGLAFVIAGLLIAAALGVFERTPPLLIPGAFLLVVFLELVYYIYVLTFVRPVLASVNWWEILIGNLVAVVSMLAYFWRRHPNLLQRLLRS